MVLTGLHLLMTYQCTHECDHCFVWGSPSHMGVMSLHDIRDILSQGKDLGTIESIYFEGGEPFLHYPILVEAVRLAKDAGFKVGIVTNSYWASNAEDAVEWLRPFAGKVDDFSVSSDLYHWSQEFSDQAANAKDAADRLGIPVGTICIAQPAVCSEAEKEEDGNAAPTDQAPLKYRGRAAVKLAEQIVHHPWNTYAQCTSENLREPGRVHIDPKGLIHVCQGITIGNLFETSLEQICTEYDPDSHPIVGPILAGGPAQLARHHGITPAVGYADSCHLCYDTRRELVGRYPDLLGPDAVYGGFIV